MMRTAALARVRRIERLGRSKWDPRASESTERSLAAWYGFQADWNDCFHLAIAAESLALEHRRALLEERAHAFANIFARIGDHHGHLCVGG